MATIEVAGLRAKVNALEHEIDSLRGELAGVREAYMEIERKLQGELVEAKALNKYMSTVLSRGSDLQRLLAPNPACGHPMACWASGSKVHNPFHIEGDSFPEFVMSDSFCTLCREKEAAVAAFAEQLCKRFACVGPKGCGASYDSKCVGCQIQRVIRALTTPTQTSAQQERK